MTNQQILEKAIQKAVDGGWRFADVNPNAQGAYKMAVYPNRVEFGAKGWSTSISINDIIFNHQFAKALWGTDRVEGVWTHHGKNSAVSERTTYPAYRHHLQQMVIAPDPIVYLGEHL